MMRLSGYVRPPQTEKQARRTIRATLEAWARHVLAPLGQAPSAHHLMLISALERVSGSPGGRLLVLMPPGSAKSTYSSVLFPAWWLARHPRGLVLTASHTQGLAEDFGRKVRTLIDEHGVQLGVRLRPEKRAAGQFLVTSGGGYFAAGVRGAVTGRRADLIILDDPVRGFADGESFAAREALWNWYRSELVTRLTPGGCIVLVMTRWHCDDIAGRLVEQGGFELLQLPAIAVASDMLGRQAGDALWPDREPLAALEEHRRVLGERAFSALFQQTPIAAGGQIFDLRKFISVDSVPVGVAVRAWDLAATAGGSGDPDWTVGVRLVRTAAGGCIIDDVVRLRGGPADVVRAITGTAQHDGVGVQIGLPQDPGQAGLGQVMFLAGQLAGFRVRSSRETGSKEVRAMPVAAQIAEGTIGFRRAAWNAALLDELGLFPCGRHDDQVDALARAYTMLCEIGTPARYAAGPDLGR